MRRKLMFMVRVLVVSFCGLMLGTAARAANQQSQGVGFEITPVPSDSQVGDNLGYFNLRLAANQVKTIAVNVHNTSNHAITIDAAMAKATTNLNGVVEYKYLAEDKSVDLPADIDKLVTTDTPVVHLTAGQAKRVRFRVKMPANDYNGILAGGLTFLKKADSAQQKQTQGSVMVKNQYSYTVALVLHGKRNVTRNHVTLGNVTAHQVNGRNVINFPIANHTAAYLNRLQTNIKIYQRGGTKVVYHQTLTDGQMAPNSLYKLPLRIGEQVLQAGKYTAVVQVKSKQQSWLFDHHFVITARVADTLNKTAVIKHRTNWWLYIGIGALLLLILLLILYILYKRRQVKKLKQALAEK